MELDKGTEEVLLFSVIELTPISHIDFLVLLLFFFPRFLVLGSVLDFPGESIIIFEEKAIVVKFISETFAISGKLS